MAKDIKDLATGYALIVGFLAVGFGVGFRSGKHHNDGKSYIDGVNDGLKIFEALKPEVVKFF